MRNILGEKRVAFGRFLTAFTAMLALCFFYMVTGGETVLAEEKAIELSEAVFGVLGEGNAMDQYVLTTKEDYTFSYRFAFNPYSPSAHEQDIMVAVYDEAGNKLGERSDWEEDAPAGKEYLEIPGCKSGKYYIRITTTSTERIEYSFRVQKANNYGKVRLSKTVAFYNGKKQKLPVVTVYDAAGKKINKSEYTYWFGRTSDKTKYRKNVSGIGEYTLYLNYGKGYYEYFLTDIVMEYHQRVFRAFVMKPEQAKINSKSAKNRKLTVSCKVSRNAKWYVWELAEDKNFKHIVKRKYWGKARETFRGLKNGKTYYVRVYIESKDGLKGAYSKPVRVKCKKS